MAAIAAAISFESSLALAQTEAVAPIEPAVDPLAWQPSWSRFSTVDYVISGALAVSLATAEIAIPTPKTNFRGGILFDDAVRDALRINTAGGRAAAGKVSDILVATLIGYPLIIDSLLLTGVASKQWDTAWQMFAIDSEAFLMSTLLTAITKDAAGRARPYTESCGSSTCGGRARNQSFFSGHSAAAFTGAGLICAHHEALPLFEGRGMDEAACVTALGLASATAVLRIAADEHYATDVLVGSAVGLLAGYVLPKLLFYRNGDHAESQIAFGPGSCAEPGCVTLNMTFVH
jgi:membrane-associated phospholipid phosphatase